MVQHLGVGLLVGRLQDVEEGGGSVATRGPSRTPHSRRQVERRGSPRMETLLIKGLETDNWRAKLRSVIRFIWKKTTMEKKKYHNTVKLWQRTRIEIITDKRVLC